MSLDISRQVVQFFHDKQSRKKEKKKKFYYQLFQYKEDEDEDDEDEDDEDEEDEDDEDEDDEDDKTVSIKNSSTGYILIDSLGSCCVHTNLLSCFTICVTRLEL